MSKLFLIASRCAGAQGLKHLETVTGLRERNVVEGGKSTNKCRNDSIIRLHNMYSISVLPGVQNL